MFSFPSAFFFGCVGITHDERRLLAAVCTLVAGGVIIFYLSMVGLNILCR